MNKELIFIGLLMIAMGAIQCHSEQQEASEQQAYIYSDDSVDELKANATRLNLYIADIIWEYETTTQVKIANFSTQDVTVTHRIEDAYALIVHDEEPTLDTWTQLLDPPAKGAKVVQIQRKRRWPTNPK